MNKEIILGIDTSNYTTSAALMYDDGELIANLKSPLTVKPGERGLRQSDAVFSHTRNIPELMRRVQEFLGGASPSAIGVSTKPRNVEGSYMPCFLSGLALASGISSALSIPMYTFSHQCGHIMAAIYSSDAHMLLEGEFAALHVSGGTTEILKCSFTGREFSSETVGGTADLNAGQVIDRVGVTLGLPFPAGRYIEDLALENKIPLQKRKPKIQDMRVNLSGLENLAMKIYGESGDKAYVSAFVLDYIERALLLLCEAFRERYGEMPYLFAGGVMSNSIIKKNIGSKLNAYFAAPAFSADNAVGIAELARRTYILEKK